MYLVYCCGCVLGWEAFIYVFELRGCECLCAVSLLGWSPRGVGCKSCSRKFFKFEFGYWRVNVDCGWVGDDS